MAARAIWKGVIKFGKVELPVKLYSAVQDHSVHFRLLHKTDHQPVKQKLVNPDTGDEVTAESVQKAFPVDRGRLLLLEREELEKLEPKESRDIEVSRFVDPTAIDHRWYDRAYYLGPDDDSADYFAAVAALEHKNKIGVARWVMRKKEYVGVLRVEQGYLMLNTLRHAEQVIDASALTPPSGRPLAAREVEMAEQLVSSLLGKFEPEEYRDEYRDRVMELVEAKSKGKKPKVVAFRPKKATEADLTDTLAASLAAVKRSAGRGR
jgi:DNA end-binding protein Ku